MAHLAGPIVYLVHVEELSGIATDGGKDTHLQIVDVGACISSVATAKRVIAIARAERVRPTFQLQVFGGGREAHDAASLARNRTQGSTNQPLIVPARIVLCWTVKAQYVIVGSHAAMGVVVALIAVAMPIDVIVKAEQRRRGIREVWLDPILCWTTGAPAEVPHVAFVPIPAARRSVRGVGKEGVRVVFPASWTASASHSRTPPIG